jgi:L-ascorbate metabolism protein UlaG (beta-lactamase superfamily)
MIYFDPVDLGEDLPQADLILVSHEHHDHCSPEDVKKIMGPDTEILASPAAAAKLPDARAIRPGDRVTAAGVDVEAVPAYNVNKFRSPEVPFHPRDAQHVGYVVTVEGTRVYFAGDTDAIPEMADIDCDLALLPVSGTYVMTAEEAAEAAKTLDPEIVVPMHYGAGIGSSEDGQRLAELYDGEVTLLEPE